MSPNILSIIENQLAQSNLINLEDQQKLCSLLRHYHTGDYIYPGAIKRQLNIGSSLTYKVLEEIVKTEVICRCYEICCFECAKTTGATYYSISEIPPYVYCPSCERELVAIKNAIQIYQVKKDE